MQAVGGSAVPLAGFSAIWCLVSLLRQSLITFVLRLALLFHFSLTLLERIWVLSHSTSLLIVSGIPIDPRLIADKGMSALASFLTSEHLRAAFRASLLPCRRWEPHRLAPGSHFGKLRFLHALGSKSIESRFIGPLHGALRMHSAKRIGSFAAYGTNILWRLRYDGNGFFTAHRFPKLQIC